MFTVHVYSANILSRTCPKMIKMPHLCQDLMGKEVCMPRPAGHCSFLSICNCKNENNGDKFIIVTKFIALFLNNFETNYTLTYPK